MSYASGPWWLAGVPDGWRVRPLFATASEVKVRNSGLAESNVLSLSYGSIVRRNVESGMGLLPESFETYNIVELGDVILRLTDLQNDKRSLRAGRVAERGIITSAYTALRFNSNTISSKLGYRYLHAVDVLKVFYQIGAGVRQSLTFSDIRRLPVLVPPRKLQPAIDGFLDREVGRLDEVAAAKRRTIELLEEKRTALITHTVTKGLNPDAPMKETNIPWLGQIPAHWRVAKLGFIAHMRSGTNITADELVDDGKYLVYGGNGVRGASDRFTHEGEFVLIGRQGALAGNVNYASGRFFASEHAVVLTPNIPAKTVWLGEMVRAMNLGQYSQASAQPGLSVDVIRGLSAPYPPLSEQQDIAEALNSQLSTLDAAADALTRQLALIAEFKSALITAAVTGQLDEATLKGEKSLDDAMEELREDDAA